MVSDAPSSSRSRAPEVPGVEDLELVGRGGHGLVYRGRQPDLGRDVAVKLLWAPAPDERAVERWRREVTAMGRLSNHPGIVTVLSEGVTPDGHPFLVMPYLPGGSLHDRIRARGPLPPDEVVEVGRRLAAALAAAHAAGVVHRDVKPGNVMFSEYDEPQLGDFGIARLADAATTTTGSVHATLEYAAPEVLSGRPATPASDVYGLGATLHAALGGASPFAGPADEPLAARVSRVVTQPPPDLRRVGVPPGLAAAVERCMAKDPADRPASAEEAGALLTDASLAPGATAPAAALPDVAPGPAALASTAALDATVVQVPSVDGVATGPSPSSALPTVPPRPHRPTTSARPGLRRALGVAALVLVFVSAAGLVWSIAREEGSDGTASATSTTAETASASSTTAETATTAPGSVPETTAPTTEATTGSTPTSAADGTPSGEEVRSAVEDYYARIGSGDAAGAWALLSPAYQARQAQDEYLAFWDSVASVDVHGHPRVAEDGGPAEVTLEFRMEDGRTSVEDVVIGVVPGEDGSLLIDSYEVVRAH